MMCYKAHFILTNRQIKWILIPIFFCKTGIFFTDTELWHEQRRFALRYLRDFGFGRRFDTLEKEVEIQIAQCIDIVKNGPKHRFERVSAFSIKFIFFFKF